MSLTHPTVSVALPFRSRCGTERRLPVHAPVLCLLLLVKQLSERAQSFKVSRERWFLNFVTLELPRASARPAMHRQPARRGSCALQTRRFTDGVVARRARRRF